MGIVAVLQAWLVESLALTEGGIVPLQELRSRQKEWRRKVEREVEPDDRVISGFAVRRMERASKPSLAMGCEMKLAFGRVVEAGNVEDPLANQSTGDDKPRFPEQ